MQDQMNVEFFLERFQKLSQNHSSKVPYSVTFSSGKPGKHVLFLFCVHGNEVGSLPAAIKSIESFCNGATSIENGDITFALGNIDALTFNKRFIENDINRSFRKKKRVESSELKRVDELAELIKNADICIDFHQTNQETLDCFYLAIPTNEHLQLARYIALTDIFVETSLEQTKEYGTIDPFAHEHNCQYLCIELSKAGYSQFAHDKCLYTIEQMVNFLNNESNNKKVKLKRLKLVYEEPFCSPLITLRPNVKNIQLVTKGEVLGQDEKGEDLIAPDSGYVFFPKYPERDSLGAVVGKLPIAIYELAKEIKNEEI